MLRTLRDLFDTLIAPPRGPAGTTDGHALQLATAVLLVEVSRADASRTPAERRAVVDGLRAHFALADDEIERLVELAEQAARRATDTFGFTSRINDAYGADDKQHIVELMWQVAYADGHLGDHERHLLWRVADLLHVPKGASAAARQRARAAAGLEADRDDAGPSPDALGAGLSGAGRAG